MRKFRRVVVWLYCATLAWCILSIAWEETKRGEMIALCDYSAVDIKEIKLSKPAPSAQAAVRLIAATVGVAPSFEVYKADDVPGVAFAGVKGGKRIIVYDAKRFRWGDNTAVWRDLCIAAHEIGHHLGTHAFLGIKPHDAETEADFFAGHTCALIGASLRQALAMTSLFSEDGSDTHPGKAKRQATITEGWTSGEILRRTGKPGSPEGAAQ